MKNYVFEKKMEEKQEQFSKRTNLQDGVETTWEISEIKSWNYLKMFRNLGFNMSIKPHL